MSLDTASKPGEHNDFSACTIWKVCGGRYYLEFVWRQKVDYPTLKKRIIAIAEVVRPDVLLIEDKVAGTGLIQDLREEAEALPVIAYEPRGDKETRMRLRAAAIEAGLVFLPRQAIWLEDFEQEVRQFPGGKHDDQIDSMSQMLDHSLSRSTGRLIVERYRS